MAGTAVVDELLTPDDPDMTPLDVDDLLDTLPQFLSKNQGDTSPAQNDYGLNVTSMTDNGVGNYVMNITNAFSAADDFAVAYDAERIGNVTNSINWFSKTASSIPINSGQDQDGASNADRDMGDFFITARGILA